MSDFVYPALLRVQARDLAGFTSGRLPTDAPTLSGSAGSATIQSHGHADPVDLLNDDALFGDLDRGGRKAVTGHDFQCCGNLFSRAECEDCWASAADAGS